MKNSKKLLFVLLTVFALIFISACDGEINMDLYTSDLLFSAGSEELTTTKVSIIIEGMSENYDYYFLENYINSFSNPHYVEYEYQTSLAFDMKVPVITAKQLETFDDDGYLFEIVRTKTTSGYSFYINLNNELIDQISSYTSSTMYQSFKLTDFDFNYKIINDSAAEKQIKVYSSYINNYAYPTSYTFNLERRDSMSVKISEILAKSFSQNQKSYFATILNS